jgi:hypothetical protein
MTQLTNGQIFTKISQLQSEIETLRGQLAPVKSVPEVDLATCNAGAVDSRMAEFAKRDEIKAAINEVLVPQVKSRTAKAKVQ